MKPQAKIVSACVWGLAEYFYILKNGDRFFTADEVRRLEEAGHTFLYMYSELRRNATDVSLWHIVPKFHQFQHIMLDACANKNNLRFFSLLQ